jgi:glyoxylase-like metal-dependent hydrolase (beta-lactamase superfamily II)
MTGDFLFTGEGGVGRDDLPSGRMRVHWDSLQVLNRFDGDLLVCTGHDPPGTEMKSLSWNRENNFVLNMTSFEEYQQWQNENNVKLGSVSKIKTAVPANLFGEIPDVIPWLD